MKNIQNMIIRILLSAIVFAIAIIRMFYYEDLGNRIDDTFLLLISAAVLILLLPWDRLSSISAGGIELTLDKPEVKGAIDGLGITRVKNKQLMKKLSQWTDEIEQVSGSRILWIDDKPHNIIGERRLLRALGADVVTVISSEMTEDILSRDNDFDMIVTDVQRKGDSYKLNDGVPIHEGVNFIVKLRNDKDPIISTLPVTFYAAYDSNRLEKFTKPARKVHPKAEIINSIEDLLEKVIATLSEGSFRSYQG